MITLNDIKLMNDALINYCRDYKPDDEKKLLKHMIIQTILEDENCFKKMPKEEAVKILEDIGIIESEIESAYNDIIR